jgi:zinc D-Ala-D-Ala carboxypeptidase
MSSSEQARPTVRRARSTSAVVLALAVAAVIGVVLGYQAVATPFSSTAPPAVTAQDDARGRAPRAPELPPRPALAEGVTVDDGVVPDGVTVFDGEFPAVADLDADLLSVLRRAATAAADDGVEFVVSSGWRSPEYQDRLLREAVSEYGSEEEAARWVATAETSAHVTGDAVDIGPADATSWLSEHGAAFALCQVYRNEPWHFELRPDAVDAGCPTPYADPTHDPRMQQ